MSVKRPKHRSAKRESRSKPLSATARKSLIAKIRADLDRPLGKHDRAVLMGRLGGLLSSPESRKRGGIAGAKKLWSQEGRAKRNKSGSSKPKI